MNETLALLKKLGYSEDYLNFLGENGHEEQQQIEYSATGWEFEVIESSANSLLITETETPPISNFVITT